MTDGTGPARADLIVTAGCVVTVDAKRRIIDDGAVAIRDGRIAAVGSREEVQSGWSAQRTIDAPAGLMTPGLIDAHNHPIDYLLKGACDDTPQIVRLRERVIPYEDGLTDEEAYLASSATFVEMIRLGTTCFVDGAGPRPEAVARAAIDCGIRGVVTRKVADLPSPFGGAIEPPEESIARADEIVEAFLGAADGRLRACFDIDLPPVVSDQLAEMVAERARARSVGVVAHLIGRPPAPGNAMPEHSADVLRLQRAGLLGPHMLLAHIGWVPPADVELLAGTGTNIVHCPASSMVGGNGWVTHGVIPDLVAAGANVTLGTDAVMISRFLDMVRVMQLAAGAHKDSRRDPTIWNPHQVFEMATAAAARALRWDDEIGSLEVGKSADLAIFDTSSPHWWPEPFANPVPDLVYGGTGHDARTVIVQGRVLMEDGEVQGIDVEALGKSVRDTSASCFARHGIARRAQWPQTI